jgi:hypothetical protein
MKIMVKYDHDPANFDIIELAASQGIVEPLEGWKAAFRDTIDGTKYVWVRFEQTPQTLWLRDRDGSRRVKFNTE